MSPLPSIPLPRPRPPGAPRPGRYIQLPQVGIGYYCYANDPKTGDLDPERQYGTEHTVHTLISLARLWVMFPTADSASYPLGFGDMSFVDGCHMDPHAAHTNGRCIDIRPMRSDRQRTGVTIFDRQYDREETERLVKLLLSNPNVHNILFNDTSIAGVHQWHGHHNHLHVQVKR